MIVAIDSIKSLIKVKYSHRFGKDTLIINTLNNVYGKVTGFFSRKQNSVSVINLNFDSCHNLLMMDSGANNIEITNVKGID